MLLNKHSVFQGNTRDQIDEFLRSKVAIATLALKPLGDETTMNCNAIDSDRFKMFSISCKLSGVFECQPFEDIRLVCPIRSSASVAFAGRTIEVDSPQSSYILPAGIPVTKRHQSEYSVLSVRISPSILKQKLEALSGAHHRAAVEFSQPHSGDERFVKFVRRPLFVVAHELDQVDPLFHTNLLEEIEVVTLTRLLLFAPHNFSHLLEPNPRAPARAQMKRAEDYLAANWNKALDVTGLAKAVGVSARTILRYFHDSYGVTPRSYLRRVRLGRARAMILAGSDTTTVVEVALRCGFSSLGNFAASYKQTFGELPSESLGRRRICQIPNTSRVTAK